MAALFVWALAAVATHLYIDDLRAEVGGEGREGPHGARARPLRRAAAGCIADSRADCAPAKPKAVVPAAKAAAPAAKATGGKARKTGMLLARAKLGTATSELAATRDRQAALLSKGTFRDAELTAREAPTGTLNVATMPKRKDAVSAAAHKEAMKARMRQTYSGKVRRSFEPCTC